MNGWYVETYQTGQETAAEAAAGGRHFDTFAPAIELLKRQRAAGAAIVRIMGPHTATEDEIQAIRAAGGVPTGF